MLTAPCKVRATFKQSVPVRDFVHFVFGLECKVPLYSDSYSTGIPTGIGHK
jgi:hypothetical protein